MVYGGYREGVGSVREGFTEGVGRVQAGCRQDSVRLT